MLTAATYFDGEVEAEHQIRQIADDLYRRVDWEWACDGEASITHGWKPETVLHADHVALSWYTAIASSYPETSATS